MLAHVADFEKYFHFIGVVYVVVVVIRLAIKALDVIYGFLLPKFFPPSNFVKNMGNGPLLLDVPKESEDIMQ